MLVIPPKAPGAELLAGGVPSGKGKTAKRSKYQPLTQEGPRADPGRSRSVHRLPVPRPRQELSPSPVGREEQRPLLHLPWLISTRWPRSRKHPMIWDVGPPLDQSRCGCMGVME